MELIIHEMLASLPRALYFFSAGFSVFLICHTFNTLQERERGREGERLERERRREGERERGERERGREVREGERERGREGEGE